MPRIGSLKLFHLLQPFMEKHNIKLWRDRFLELMKLHSMGIRKHRNVIRTTNSYHHFRKYNNLIRNYSSQLCLCNGYNLC